MLPKILRGLILLSAAAVAQPRPAPAAVTGGPQAWLTSADRVEMLAPVALGGGPPNTPADVVGISTSRRFQVIDGFGFAMTGGSALLIQHMSPAKRHALLRDIFGSGAEQAGVRWLRVSIGSSDMDDHVFTYDDQPPGVTDASLVGFSLLPDERALIPLLREILSINPDLKILASPWSAPAWMKTNDAPRGGRLRADMQDAFARYLVAYVEGMQRRGIPISAVTLQNEPENGVNMPSMLMEAGEQAELISDHVGPAFRAAGVSARIMVFDHNVQDPSYPLAVLGSRAQPYCAGTAFHLYRGDASAMSQVHEAYPTKPVWLTEQLVTDDLVKHTLTPVAQPIARVVNAALNNWAQGVILWNLAADPAYGPHTEGGCPICQGAVTIDGDRVTRNVAYAAIAQVARYVPPGSVRVASSSSDPSLSNVAFLTPTGAVVLVVANPGAEARAVDLGQGWITLPSGAAVTVRWPPGGLQAPRLAAPDR